MSYSRERIPSRTPEVATPEVSPPGQGVGEENSLLQDLLRAFGPHDKEGGDESKGAGHAPSWLDGIERMGPIAGRRVSPNGSKTGRA